MNQLGTPQCLTSRVVGLWWYSVAIPDNGDLDGVLTRLRSEQSGVADSPESRALSAPGVYVFEGCHDSRPTGGVLYIGQVGADSESTDKPARQILERASESFSRFAWKQPRARGEQPDVGLFADVWNVRLRWAQVQTESIRDVERLLILAHAPSFNSQNVRSTPPVDAADLLVMNAGAKGMLLPVVAGKYFDAAFWNALEEPPLGG